MQGQGYPDTAKGEAADVKLTKDWKQYTIDLKGKDCRDQDRLLLSSAGGQAVTFYLDEIGTSEHGRL